MMRIVDRFLDRTTMYRLTAYYLGALLSLGIILGAAGVLRASALAIVWTSFELIAVSWLAGIVAILSKYRIPPGGQHIFNPAAFGVFFAGIIFNQYASWWVESATMLPLVALGGVLILRKTVRFRMAGLFFGFFAVFLTGISLIQGFDLSMYLLTVKVVFVNTGIVFFAVIMLTGPATSPKRFRWRALYSAIVAFLFLPQLNVGGFSFTPELALLIGNLFSYFTAPCYKAALRLVEKRKIGTDTLEFVFTRPRTFRHEAGQYMEWTLPIRKADSRGNRRYFTIASAPTEEEVRIAARFFEHPSAYKDGLADMQPGDDEITYRELFCDAEQKLGLAIVYTLTDPEHIPAEWTGQRGFVNAAMIEEHVPDYRKRVFYISG